MLSRTTEILDIDGTKIAQVTIAFDAPPSQVVNYKIAYFQSEKERMDSKIAEDQEYLDWVNARIADLTPDE